MSKIRSKNTKPELFIRKFLFHRGFRFRIHSKVLPGKPDIVLKKHKTVIFINGCFWHMHGGCKYSLIPSSNKEYWIPKLLKNVQKDKAAISELKKMKWRVIVIWECELRPNKQQKTLDKIIIKVYIS